MIFTFSPLSSELSLGKKERPRFNPIPCETKWRDVCTLIRLKYFTSKVVASAFIFISIRFRRFIELKLIEVLLGANDITYGRGKSSTLILQYGAS